MHGHGQANVAQTLGDKHHDGVGYDVSTKVMPDVYEHVCRWKQKKTDVVEHPEVFDHVGLLFNKPPGQAGLLFI